MDLVDLIPVQFKEPNPILDHQVILHMVVVAVILTIPLKEVEPTTRDKVDTQIIQLQVDTTDTILINHNNPVCIQV